MATAAGLPITRGGVFYALAMAGSAISGGEGALGLLLAGGQARRLDELRVLRAAQLGDPDLLAGGLLCGFIFVGDAVGDGDRWVLDIHGSIAGSVVDVGGKIRLRQRADVPPWNDTCGK